MSRAPRRLLPAAFAVLAPVTAAVNAQGKIYWGDAVPRGWNGKWPQDLQTVSERTGFTRTVSSLPLLEFISALKQTSENIHVVNMFVSPLRKSAPAIVLARPRITSAQEARASGKPVVFLFGNIHPPEPEGRKP
jgi:hypothetical protein